MQIHEAAEVVQIVGDTDANEKLAQGWKLLAVVPGLAQGSSLNTLVI
ncbi:MULTISPECIES: hypothetical protein [Pseudomonas]|uniref:DUF1737 domain-containing protein n=2 Tax=Pseudomonas TaxID=286 RepID=A0A7Y1Q2B0_9PSED|nr:MULTISPECIES: hypothetical protein [Pseudomonas]NNA48201.1 hypothetical protein [Pseudomonas lactis]SDP02542.1 hypothetical protein SAMN04490202_2611 [Pseudomonas reinekei]